MRAADSDHPGILRRAGPRVSGAVSFVVSLPVGRMTGLRVLPIRDGAEMSDKIRRLLFDFRRKRLPSQSRGGSHKISQNIIKYQIAGCPAGPDDEALTAGHGKEARIELQSGCCCLVAQPAAELTAQLVLSRCPMVLLGPTVPTKSAID